MLKLQLAVFVTIRVLLPATLARWLYIVVFKPE